MPMPGHRGPGDPSSAPAMPSRPYGSGAASTAQIPTIAVDPHGANGITPPHSPRFFTPPGSPRFPAGGTTRRDRAERQEERRRARSEHRGSLDPDVPFEDRVQDWVSRLISAERTVREAAQDFAALRQEFADHIATNVHNFDDFRDRFSSKI